MRYSRQQYCDEHNGRSAFAEDLRDERFAHDGKQRRRSSRDGNDVFGHPLTKAALVALVLVALALPVTAVPVLLNAEEMVQNTVAENIQERDTSMSIDEVGSAEKKEVIYSSLDDTGAVQGVYVVNVLQGTAGQVVQDFGTYDQVVNLTDTSEIAHLSDSVIFTMPEGDFSYQGTMENASLPWNITVGYRLDGQVIDPEELAGKSGELEIVVSTSQNKAVDSRYYENYLMQITCTFPISAATNIRTDQGSIALSGSDTTVSFMVMPGSEGEVSLSADVESFEMDGMSFAAIPFSMAIDSPDTEDLLSQFDALIEGAEQLDQGADELTDGVEDVDDAAKQAAKGAQDLAAGATQMTQGLELYQQGLRERAEEAQSSISQDDLDAAKRTYEDALGVYTAAYAQAYEQIIASYEANGQLIDEQTRKAALAQAAASLQGSVYESNMTEALETLLVLSSTQAASQGAVQALSGAADGLGSTDDPSSLLGGSASLGAGTQELAEGLDQLAGGTGQLTSGAESFAQGTRSLAQETQGIPEAVQTEIDAMMATYDKSDFETASFTSSKNTDVTLVQFVMTTDPIKIDEPEPVEEPQQEETLLDRFLALFS